ncbi:MAG: hypothetical protein IPM47_00790 [Sphingobacteriales bacterium]|nr:MAG: hypothetical protein IPM47_00790 [Sphingobacteriales bacterium]
MKSVVSKTVILFFFVLLFSNCRLFFDMDCNDNYEFHLPYTVYPAQDTFHINDTLTIYANFSDMLLDSNSLNYYKVENLPLYNFLYMAKIDTVPSPQGFQNFTLIADTGAVFDSSDPGHVLRHIVFLYQNSRYQFSLRLIPHKVGVYWLGLGATPNQEVDFQKRCPGELMTQYFTTNGGINNNYYLLTLSPDSSYNIISEAAFNKSGSFCFRVVE